MLKLLGSIAVLVAVAAGCGSDEPAPSAAPAPTPAPEIPAHVKAAHRFDKGHSRAVREYYGGADGEYDTGGGGDVEAEFHQPPRPASGGIGDTITLTGSNIGVRMRVRVLGVVDPVETSRPPRAGKRFVAVKLRMRSTGITILDGELHEAVVSYDGGRARAVLGVAAVCSGGFNRSFRVEVGDAASGCVLFELPSSARPRRLQLALEQVPAEAGGRWRLR
jgi:hypothetical protein